MKKTLLSSIILLSFYMTSFSQTKTKEQKVIVEFQDSTTYINFLSYLGTIPVSSPYSQLFNYFKSLPAHLEADKPKQK